MAPIQLHPEVCVTSELTRSSVGASSGPCNKKHTECRRGASLSSLLGRDCSMDTTDVPDQVLRDDELLDGLAADEPRFDALHRRVALIELWNRLARLGAQQ